MTIRVVLVEPQFSGNVGSVARVMANFGVKDLWLVSPVCDHLSEEARMYAKRAFPILERAKVVDNLKKAIKGSFSIGTTAEPFRYTSSLVKEVLPLSKAVEVIKEENISLVFGSEGEGLREEHFRVLNTSVFIETSEEYSAMNLSHAVAVVLYSFSVKRSSTSYRYETWKEAHLSTVERLSNDLTRLLGLDPRTPQAFRNIISKSYATQKEVGYLLKALRRAVQELSSCRGEKG